MANLPTPRINSGMDLTAIMAEINLLLQMKGDRDGSEVSDADTNTQAGARWFNAVDDWLIALQTRIESVAAGAMQVLDTRETGASTTASIASLASGNFTIAVPTSRLLISFLRCRRNAGEGSAGGVLSLYVDSARTKLCYESLMQEGSPPEDVADFTDCLAFGAYSDDGTGLEDLILYGTVENLSDSSSTYTIRLVAHCA